MAWTSRPEIALLRDLVAIPSVSGTEEGIARWVVEWAEAAGTISYEIVTRAGGRLVRRHVGEGAELWT